MASNGSLTNTFGANLLGTFGSAMLYGLTVHQTYRYFRRYTADRWTLKTLVAGLWTIDTLQTAFSMYYCYYYLVNHHSDSLVMERSIWAYRLAVFLMAAPPFISNTFYVSRLWIIGMQSFALLAFIMSLVLTRLSFQIVLAVKSWQHPAFVDFAPFTWMVRAYCGASLTADIILAVSFCYTLHKRRTGYKRTDSKIDLLMIYTINTGSLTSLLCLLSLMSLVFSGRRSTVYVALHAILAKFYINSVLAVLNSRKPRTRRDESLYEIAAFESTNARPKSSRIVFRRASDSTNGPVDIHGMIRIHQETTTDTSTRGADDTFLSDQTLQDEDPHKIVLEKV